MNVQAEPTDLCVHVVSETAFSVQGQGVHTAFLDLVELLRAGGAVDVTVNGDGWGDLFHAHTYGPYYFWKGRKYENCRIYTAHVVPASIEGSIPFARWLRPIAEWYFRQVWSYADVCVAVSPSVAETIRRSRADTKVVQICNPVSTDRFAPSPALREEGRAEMGLAETDFVVLGVGQLQARKGVETFIDVAEACPEATFVWAGGRPFKTFTEGVARIDRRIEEAPSNVRFIGQVDFEDMPKVYNAADLFLFPSHQETFGLAAAEAAAAGLPVIFRDLPVYETLHNGDYCRAAQTSDFIALTKRLMKDTQFYDEIQTVSQMLTEPFEPARIHEQLISLYKTVSTDSP